MKNWDVVRSQVEERTVAGVGVDELDLNSFQSYLKRLGLDIEVEPQIAVEDDLRSRGVLADLGTSVLSPDPELLYPVRELCG